MRADRVIAVLLLLQRRGRLTVAQVAAELETSQRTARRDLEALALAGVPVFSTRARGGGWELVGGARTDLSGLTSPEAQALLLAAGRSAADPAARGGAVQAPGGAARAVARRCRTGGRGGPGRHGVVGGGPAAGPTGAGCPPARRRRGRRGGAGVPRPLRFELPGAQPAGPGGQGRPLVPGAETAAGSRTFRADRVTAVVPTGRAGERPPGFDLREVWVARRGQFEAHRHAEHARAAVDPAVLPRMCRLLAHRLQETGGVTDDGRVEVVVVGPVPEVTALELAGLGARVEFLDPAARRRLRALAAELAALYGDPPAPG